MHNESNGPDPTPEEIEQLCQEIQEQWNEPTRAKREAAGGESWHLPFMTRRNDGYHASDVDLGSSRFADGPESASDGPGG